MEKIYAYINNKKKYESIPIKEIYFSKNILIKD